MTGDEFGGVDIDLLADYVGGALAGMAEESVVAARIAGDPEWRAAYESLTGGVAFVRAELGRLTAEPMPAELAASLDAMFRDLAVPYATGSNTPEASSAAGAAADPIVDAAPIAADLPASATPHLSLVRGDGQGEEPVGGRRADAVREKSTVQQARRRNRWATPIAIAAGVVAFVGFGLDYLAGRSGDGDASSSDSVAGSGLSAEANRAAPSNPPLSLLATGTDYTLGTLAVPPAQTMAAPDARHSEAPKIAAQESPETGESPALARLRADDALRTCLAAIQQENAGGVITVETVDFARFDGAPALVVHFHAANGQWAWASGPSCGTPSDDADTLGKVPVR